MICFQEIWIQLIIENMLQTLWKIVSSSVVAMIIDMPDSSLDLSAGVQIPTIESMEHQITVIHRVQVMLNKYVVDLWPTVCMMFHLK